MTWEETFAAIIAIAPRAALHMRKPGDWYVGGDSLEIGDGKVLSAVCGNGSNPEAAVEDYWRKATHVDADKFLVKDAFGPNRRHLRWNGFMWEDVPR